MRLRTADDMYTSRLSRPVEVGGFWPHQFPPPRKGVALDLAVDAFVNEGRWIVQCPWCGGAQLVSPETFSVLCVECANNGIGGMSVPVRWPDEAPAIEAALVQRPAPRHMNWRPGETVDDLLAENEQRGL